MCFPPAPPPTGSFFTLGFLTMYAFSPSSLLMRDGGGRRCVGCEKSVCGEGFVTQCVFVQGEWGV
jgi:hypothetical protein